jgi:hypothetical protein
MGEVRPRIAVPGIVFSDGCLEDYEPSWALRLDGSEKLRTHCLSETYGPHRFQCLSRLPS